MGGLSNEFFDSYLNSKMEDLGLLKNKDFLRGGGLSLFDIFTYEKNSPFEMISYCLACTPVPKEEHLDYWIEYASHICDEIERVGLDGAFEMRYNFLEKYYLDKSQFDQTYLSGLSLIGAESKVVKNIKKNPLCVLLFKDFAEFFLIKGHHLNCKAEVINCGSRLFTFIDNLSYINCFECNLSKTKYVYKFTVYENWHFEAPSCDDIVRLS